MATTTRRTAAAAVVMAVLPWTSSAAATERSAAVASQQLVITLGCARVWDESEPSGCLPCSSELAREPNSARNGHRRPFAELDGNTFSADDPPTAVVRVDNLAAVRADDLQFAEDRAAAVFGKIGARVIWIDEDREVRDGITAPFTLVLVNAEDNVGLAAVPGIEDALGLARPQVHRAHVFYDRIDALRTRAPMSIVNILGDVMAHELGHLLLPLPGHSADGIMRTGVYIRARRLETFTPPQAREIVCRLRRVP